MRTRLLALGAGLLLLSGCATKRDLRTLTIAVDSMRTSQDAMLRELQRQNLALRDSVNAQHLHMRGDLMNQMLRMEQQLVQVQELTGQGAQQLSTLREQIRAREEALRTQVQDSEGAAPVSGASAQELYDASLASLKRGSYSTARAGFEELVRSFPRHALAADAQFQIGESYAGAKDLPRALEAYARVVELYPASPRAASALYRSAVLELERGNRDRARTLFTQVSTAYPRSPEAAQAKDQLAKIKR